MVRYKPVDHRYQLKFPHKLLKFLLRFQFRQHKYQPKFLCKCQYKMHKFQAKYHQCKTPHKYRFNQHKFRFRLGRRKVSSPEINNNFNKEVNNNKYNNK